MDQQSVEQSLKQIQAVRKAKQAAEAVLPPHNSAETPALTPDLEVKECSFLRFQDKGCRIGIKVWTYACLKTLDGMSASSKSGELVCQSIHKVQDGFVVFANNLESGRAWISNVAVESAIPVI